MVEETTRCCPESGSTSYVMRRNKVLPRVNDLASARSGDAPDSAQVRPNPGEAGDLSATSEEKTAGRVGLMNVPRSLNHGLDCANASRNLAENFTEEQAFDWIEHRKVVLSEMSLSLEPVFKTFLFEVLPLWMSCPLCFCMEGVQAATNRGINLVAGITWTNFPQKIFWMILWVVILDAQGLTYYLIIFWALHRDSLAPAAPFEAFGMIFLAMIAKALVVAVKYGFKSDMITFEKDCKESIYNDGYEKTNQRSKNQVNLICAGEGAYICAHVHTHSTSI